MKPTPVFHANAPRYLIRLWKDYPAYWRIAKYLDVNPSYIYKALKFGKEPNNTEIRRKFHLPKRKRKTQIVTRTQTPAYLKWWRRLDPSIRNMYIDTTFREWAEKAPNVQSADASRR